MYSIVLMHCLCISSFVEILILFPIKYTCLYVFISSEDQPYVYKDAIFMSAHKFVGGVQTPGRIERTEFTCTCKYNKPGRCSNYTDTAVWERDRFTVISFSFRGILVAKKKLFKNKIPDNCGGGTVFYVRDLLSHYAYMCNQVVIHNNFFLKQ